MKTYSHLWPQMVDFGCLLKAYRLAKKGTGKTHQSEAFSFHLERELLQLETALREETYQPQPYRYFRIFEPKERIISVAPFRDRVVHHAVIQVLEPIYETCFYHHSYATRKNKGTHSAIMQAQQWVGTYPWFFKADLHKYFDSIDHKILLDSLARKLKDDRLMNLLSRIIANGGEAGKGLPIGNLTSQFLANVYLHPLDVFIKQGLRIKAYIRYMDDYTLFHTDKQVLKQARKAIEFFLAEHLALQHKPTACYLGHSRNGLSFLGARIFPQMVRIKPENLHRATRRMRRKRIAYLAGKDDLDTFLHSMNSYWAYLRSYDTLALRRDLVMKGL